MRRERRDERNGTHQRDERQRMTAGDERTTAAARFTGGGGSPVAGSEGEAAAGLLHPLAHPRAATASGATGVRPAAAAD